MGAYISAFQQAFQEGEIIGRMVLAYGELEFTFSMILSTCLENGDSSIQLLYRLRSENDKLEVGDAIIRPRTESVGLSNVYNQFWAAINLCRSIRNQYAHAHFFRRRDKKLCLIDFALAAKSRKTMPKLPYQVIEGELLAKQDDYFDYTQSLGFYLYGELQRKILKRSDDPHRKPKGLPPVPLYSFRVTHGHQDQATSDAPRRKEQPLKPPTS